MEDDANTSFNKFLNIYLRMFHCCFIKKHTNCKAISKPWLTKGIQTSCNRKRELYLKMRDNNEMKHKLYYKQYCKITKVIKEAKKNCTIKKPLVSQKIKLKPHGTLFVKKQVNEIMRVTLIQ